MNDSGGHYPFVGNDPKSVDKAVGELVRLGIKLLGLAGDVHRDTASILEAWPSGHTGQLAARDAARMDKSLDECSKAFKGAAGALDGLVQPLVDGRTKVHTLNDSYRMLSTALSVQGDHSFADYLNAGNGGGEGVLLPEETRRHNRAEVAKDALANAQNKTGFYTLTEIDQAYQKTVVKPVTEHSDHCNKTLRQLTDGGRAQANHGHAVGETMYDVSFCLLSALAAPQVADILSGNTPFPTDPKAVHDAWMELSADQQMHLLNNDPKRFGNLNGIPVKDREKANRFVLKNEMGRVKAALKAAGIDDTIDPEVFDSWEAGNQAGVLGTRANRVRDALAKEGMSIDQAAHALRLSQQLTPDDGTNANVVHLLAYEPGADNGNGRAAIAYGDVDGAENVAVCVPGLNSTLGNFQNVSGDARNLFQAAKATDPSKQTAVIAWQGYDAPNLLEVGFQGHAEIGSKLLAADVNALRVTHDGAIKGKLTVVGHSYGSTTTSLAFQRERMHGDQGVLIGSPGAGGDAKTAADLHLGKNTLFTGSASRDVVTSVTRGFGHSLGADPTADQFGESATRFKAENVNRGEHINAADHSLYYDVDSQSESLYSLAYIVTGYGDRLGQEGMVAEPRHTVHEEATDESGGYDWVADREGHRTPTAGHVNTPVTP